MQNSDYSDTIVAIATPYGTGGIAVIRLSGPEAIAIADRAWRGRPLCDAPSHTARFGTITADDADTPLDQSVATVFRAPRSFTGEDTVEISVHGSKWIQKQAVDRFVALGARPAEPGEFTRRAFLNGRMDLAQAEGVADLIAASSRAAHRLAMSQVAGGFSARIDELRGRLVDLASLLELELDFSEEDVEFADRANLRAIADETIQLIDRLASTYAAGRAFKEGVPVAIAGRPNAGKSTLLNALLGEDKAIVSDIPGTTRDIIDDTREMGGILFRFYDTAGLRDAEDEVEKIGIGRARDAIGRAAIVLWLIDTSTDKEEINSQIEYVKEQIKAHEDPAHIIIFNKTDIAGMSKASGHALCETSDNSVDSDSASGYSIEIQSVGHDIRERVDVRELSQELSWELSQEFPYETLTISAKRGTNLDLLERLLVDKAKRDHDPDAELIITNARHHSELISGGEAMRRVREALDTGLSADFIAQDVRTALHHLGTVTGAVTTDTLLTTIFTRFCIGK